MCKELDEYLKRLEEAKGRGAISEFADKMGVKRLALWRYRTGKIKPTTDNRLKIKRLTQNEVLPEHFK